MCIYIYIYKYNMIIWREREREIIYMYVYIIYIYVYIVIIVIMIGERKFPLRDMLSLGAWRMGLGVLRENLSTAIIAVVLVASFLLDRFLNKGTVLQPIDIMFRSIYGQMIFSKSIIILGDGEFNTMMNFNTRSIGCS